MTMQLGGYITGLLALFYFFHVQNFILLIIAFIFGSMFYMSGLDAIGWAKDDVMSLSYGYLPWSCCVWTLARVTLSTLIHHVFRRIIPSYISIWDRNLDGFQ